MRIADRIFLLSGFCVTLLAVGVALADEQATPPQPTATPATKPQKARETAAPTALPLSGSLQRLTNQMHTRTRTTASALPMPTSLDLQRRAKERPTVAVPNGLGISGGIMKSHDRPVTAAPNMSLDVTPSLWTPPEREKAKAPIPRKPEWWIFAARPMSEAPPPGRLPTIRWFTRSSYVVTVCQSCRGLVQANQDRSSPGVGFALPELVGTDGVVR